MEPSPLEVFFGRPRPEVPEPAAVAGANATPDAASVAGPAPDTSWEPEDEHRFGQASVTRAPPWARVRGTPAGVAAAAVAVMVAAGVAVVAAGVLGGTPANPDLPFAVVAGADTGPNVVSSETPDVPEPNHNATSGPAGHIPGGSSPPASGGSLAVADVVVHVAGAVEHPGVYSLRAGARVHDAVAAAGGLRHDADPDVINLAETVVDGARIHVPVPGESPRPAAGQIPPNGVGGGDTGGGPGTPVSLNVATSLQLQALPGVGPATADAIIEHRTANGPFTSVEDLMDVRGIGPAKLGALRDLVVP